MSQLGVCVLSERTNRGLQYAIAEVLDTLICDPSFIQVQYQVSGEGIHMRHCALIIWPLPLVGAPQ